MFCRHVASVAKVMKLNLAEIRKIRCKHTLPPLPYELKALEPVISGEIMHLHHSKHHAAYVNNLNIAEEQLAEAFSQKDVTKIISLQSALRFNGGGHINHSIFWHNLSSKGGGVPTGSLGNAINEEFGSFDSFKSKLSPLPLPFRVQVGVGLDIIPPQDVYKSQHVLTKTRLKEPQV
ncbi:unnamed protein product [Heterobilharzia americana]|nr:unnamed protein product [Heterobilharzia americana]